MLIMFLFFSVAAYAMEHNATHKPLTKANGSRAFETTAEILWDYVAPTQKEIRNARIMAELSISNRTSKSNKHYSNSRSAQTENMNNKPTRLINTKAIITGQNQSVHAVTRSEKNSVAQRDRIKPGARYDIKKKCLLTPERKKSFLEIVKKQSTKEAKKAHNNAKLYRQKNDVVNEAMAYSGAAYYFSQSLQCYVELNQSLQNVIAAASANEDRFFEIFSTVFAPLSMAGINEADRYRASVWRSTVLDFAPTIEIKSGPSYPRVKSLQEITLEYVANRYFNSISEISASNMPQELKLKLFQACNDYKISFDERIANIVVFHGKHTQKIADLCEKKKNSQSACLFYERTLKYCFAAVSLLLSQAKVLQFERDNFKDAQLAPTFKKKLDLSLQKQRNFFLRKTITVMGKIVRCINTLKSIRGTESSDRATYINLNEQFLLAYPETKNDDFEGIHTN